MSAEYLLAGGNGDVILCERGVRTFSDHSRNTLDLSVIPPAKALCHLPILVDPSHGTGRRDYVPPMALAALAAGADGLLIEVHPDPDNALSDGAQSLDFDAFERLLGQLKRLGEPLGRIVFKTGSGKDKRASTRKTKVAETILFCCCCDFSSRSCGGISIPAINPCRSTSQQRVGAADLLYRLGCLSHSILRRANAGLHSRRQFLHHIGGTLCKVAASRRSCPTDPRFAAKTGTVIFSG